MTPSALVNDAMLTLLAEDPATLAPATLGNKVFLVAENFSPGVNTDVADLLLATFPGSEAKVAGPGPQTVLYDPVAAQRSIVIKDPAGGWTWVATADPTTPETVYGIVMTDNAGTVTLGSGLLPAPVQIRAAGDGVVIEAIKFSTAGVSLF